MLLYCGKTHGLKPVAWQRWPWPGCSPPTGSTPAHGKDCTNAQLAGSGKYQYQRCDRLRAGSGPHKHAASSGISQTMTGPHVRCKLRSDQPRKRWARALCSGIPIPKRLHVALDRPCRLWCRCSQRHNGAQVRPGMLRSNRPSQRRHRPAAALWAFHSASALHAQAAVSEQCRKAARLRSA